jgi:hypothetical protein
MKKWIIIICLFLITITSILYFLVPANQNLGYQTIVNCTESGASRQILNKGSWQLWWSAQKVNDTLYTYQHYTYRIDKVLLNGIEVTLLNNKDSVKGFLQFQPYGTDSTQFQWTYKNNFSVNPLKRFDQYLQLKKSGKTVESLLGDIKKYFDNPENIYGLKITMQKVVESSLISLKNTFQHYPSTEEIYGMIQSVKEYIKKTGGEEAGYPMLHVEKEGAEIFETMVAMPTTNDLPAQGQFQVKHMHMGFMLAAEVTGGVYRVVKGEKELSNYVSDYKRNSPAIPFQSLVTNRLLETDSTKWVTRLYYPVF